MYNLNLSCNILHFRIQSYKSKHKTTPKECSCLAKRIKIETLNGVYLQSIMLCRSPSITRESSNLQSLQHKETVTNAIPDNLSSNTRKYSQGIKNPANPALQVPSEVDMLSFCFCYWWLDARSVKSGRTVRELAVQEQGRHVSGYSAITQLQ
jgi:hypothetical protein